MHSLTENAQGLVRKKYTEKFGVFLACCFQIYIIGSVVKHVGNCLVLMQMLYCLPLLVENIDIWHLRDSLREHMYLMFFIPEYLCDVLGCILIWGSYGILKKFISFELLLQVHVLKILVILSIPWNIGEKRTLCVFYLRCFIWFPIILSVFMHWNCCSAWVMIARVQ